MKESIEELAGIWHTYLNKVHEDKSERAYELIYNVLPAELGFITPKDSNLLVGSSGGTGKITAGPWFATFQPHARGGKFQMLLTTGIFLTSY